MTARLAITSVGARTSLGLDAQQNGFLYRTGVAALRQAALLDSAGKGVTFAVLESLPPYLAGVDRAWELGRPALDECIAPVADVLKQLRVGVFTCVDEFMGEKGLDGWSPAMELGARVQRHIRLALHESVQTQSVAAGAATAGMVLADAIESLSSGRLDAVLVGGIHSDYDLGRIRALEAAGRLYAPEQMDALLPGEGSAWVLLVSETRLRELGMRTHARLLGTGAGHEQALAGNDESAYEAGGLTLAVHRACEELRQQGGAFGWWLSDVGFEAFRLAEWQSVMVRTSDLMCDPQRLDTPAQRLGHLGGAALPFAWVLAFEAWRRGWAPHERALCTAGSDSGHRAAVLLGAP